MTFKADIVRMQETRLMAAGHMAMTAPAMKMGWPAYAGLHLTPEARGHGTQAPGAWEVCFGRAWSRNWCRTRQRMRKCMWECGTWLHAHLAHDKGRRMMMISQVPYGTMGGDMLEVVANCRFVKMWSKLLAYSWPPARRHALLRGLK